MISIADTLRLLEPDRVCKTGVKTLSLTSAVIRRPRVFLRLPCARQNPNSTTPRGQPTVRQRHTSQLPRKREGRRRNHKSPPPGGTNWNSGWCYHLVERRKLWNVKLGSPDTRIRSRFSIFMDGYASLLCATVNSLVQDSGKNSTSLYVVISTFGPGFEAYGTESYTPASLFAEPIDHLPFKLSPQYSPLPPQASSYYGGLPLSVSSLSPHRCIFVHSNRFLVAQKRD